MIKISNVSKEYVQGTKVVKNLNLVSAKTTNLRKMKIKLLI